MKIKKSSEKSQFALRPLRVENGTAALRGELPVSPLPLPCCYYRHMERLLRRHCQHLPEGAEVTVSATIRSCLQDSASSILVKAELLLNGTVIPFFTDACVWDPRRGLPLPLSACTGRSLSRRAIRKRLLPRREPLWALRNCPDWARLSKKALDPHSFYPEEHQLVFVFPPMTLGSLLENSCRIPNP